LETMGDHGLRFEGPAGRVDEARCRFTQLLEFFDELESLI